MSRVLTAASIAAAFAARYPRAGVIDSVNASEGKLPSVDAQAVRGFATVTGKLLWVQALDHFYEAGELIKAGDFVEMRELDANSVISRGLAKASTAVEAAAADIANKTEVKGPK
jgi:hypothetical protein